MFCTQCGTKVDDMARFCTSCGTPMLADIADAAVIPSLGHRLRRVRSQKKLAGVCAGFAEYFAIDVTLVRVVWLVMALVPPSIGVIAYFVAWAVLPSD